MYQAQNGGYFGRKNTPIDNVDDEKAMTRVC